MMSSEELEQVWSNIKSEARALAECEPMLASFFHATLLKHENLGSALSYILANKLANPIMPAIAIREVVEEAYRSDAHMIVSAARDILAVRLRDPAVDKYSTPLLYLKGFHALQAYRIGHWLWAQDRKALAIYLQNQVSVALVWISTLRQPLVVASCWTTLPVSLLVKRLWLRMTCLFCNLSRLGGRAKPVATAIQKSVKVS